MTTIGAAMLAPARALATVQAPVAWVDAPLSLTPFNTSTNTAGSAIPAPAIASGGFAITPDGSTAYLSQSDGSNNTAGTVTPINLSTGTIGTAITVGNDPMVVAITPDGSRAYVTNEFSNSVSAIDTATNTVIATIAVGVHPIAIAITPDGQTAYVANTDAGTVTPIDIATNTAGSPITVGSLPNSIAITPNGHTVYVLSSSFISGLLTPVDTTTSTQGSSMGVSSFSSIAITPAQGPIAAFTADAGGAGHASSFDASASTTPDGTITTYHWIFGDGQSASTSQPTITHTYATAGSYSASLTVSASSGCSGESFTGRTAYCNGLHATATHSVVVASPPSNNSPPQITGTAEQGETLTASAGTWSDPEASISYQWQDCDNTGEQCVAIEGATSSSYTLGAGDVGHTVVVIVTATDDAGSTSSRSPQTGVVAPSSTPTPTPTPPISGGAPVSTAPPLISGTDAVGHVLTVSNGTWSGTTTGFTYQWLRDGAPIPGATNSTYTVRPGDQGHTLSCNVTAADGTSASASAARTSAGVAIPIISVNTCPRPSGQLAAAKLGAIALGLTRTHARRLLPRFTRRSYHTDNFCLAAGQGIRVGYASRRLLDSASRTLLARVNGRVVIALTANPFYALKGVRPGNRLAAASRLLKLGEVIHSGLNDWYVISGPGSNGVLKVRHGIVQEVGIANHQLTHDRAAQIDLLRQF